MLSVSITPSLTSPQVQGTQIPLTAVISGETWTAPYQTTWRVRPLGSNPNSWTVVQSWATSLTHVFRPPAPGTYRVVTWVRRATDTQDSAQAAAYLDYTILSLPPAPTICEYTVTMPNSQVAGLADHEIDLQAMITIAQFRASRAPEGTSITIRQV